jgi:hypothetical protein
MEKTYYMVNAGMLDNKMQPEGKDVVMTEESAKYLVLGGVLTEEKPVTVRTLQKPAKVEE